ncbi:MAG: PD-(D/E)XK nuclease family protein, partial [Allosphingosinicella sp.]
PRPLAPSALGEDDFADPPPSPALRAAALRGKLLHQLFERLPDVPESERAARADRWLERAAGVGDEALRRALVADACRIIADPAHRELFGPASLAEAPIAVVVGEGLVVSGTVDRLLIEEGRVVVADFKTGRHAPAALSDIPVPHLRQMAAYSEALRVIFPGRRIEAKLLYTAGPVLHDLPEDLLAAHLPALPAPA